VWTNVFVQSFDGKSVDKEIKANVDNICYKCRIYVNFETENGSLLFDDFKAVFDYTAEYVYQDEEILQEDGVENKKVIRNYDPKKNYYYRVRATDKQHIDTDGRYENITDYSNEICVGDNEDKNVTVEPLDLMFVDGHFVVSLKELKPDYVIYVYTVDGRLVDEIEPTTKKVILPRLEANMYVVKYSEKGKIRRKDQMGKIFY
jgi:hypothetical protein